MNMLRHTKTLGFLLKIKRFCINIFKETLILKILIINFANILKNTNDTPL
jgi:hypothetical protein